jgi:hypothetical protein
MGRVLVSSELEDIIDKDNILGSDSQDLNGLVRVTCNDSTFSGTLEKIKISPKGTRLEISFLPTQIDAVSSLLLREDRSFLVGSGLKVEARLSKQLSYSIVREKDIYIWKIITDNSE